MVSQDCREPGYLDSFHRDHPGSDVLISIADYVINSIGGTAKLEAFFGPKLRQALDEVIDMPRTGRYCLEQTEKTEKTYVGTKVEIVLRHELGLAHGRKLDAQVNGIEVDIKNTTGSGWMIPREAVDEICLLAKSSDEKGTFSVGLILCAESNLSTGGNQDKKKSISAKGKMNILWIVQNGKMPENIFLNMSAADRGRIFNAGAAKKRLAALFRTRVGVITQRYHVESVAQQLDYMKRIRRNGGAQDDLDAEGLEILWGGRKDDNDAAQSAGYRPLTKDEFICLKKADLGI